MKKIISTLALALITILAQAQILTPVKWKVKVNDNNGSPEKEIVFTATLDKGCPSMLDTRKISEVKRVYDYLNNPVLTSL